MDRIPAAEYKLAPFSDEDVIRSWKWFISFMSEREWKKRKESIEAKISLRFKATSPSSEILTLVVKEDLIGWYLYLIDVLINEPYKYEFFQGARIVPIFKRFGSDLESLKRIHGIEKRIKDLLQKRKTEADAFLFEFLTALLWVRNGYHVAFVEEQQNKKTPDFTAKMGGKIWNIECKRQSKTADYTYKETAKRQRMISYLSKTLIENNILLDITFHVELESLPDTFLSDLLEQKLKLAIPGKIVSDERIDVDLDFVDIAAVREHLRYHFVKHHSPQMNWLIGKRPVDNKAFTCGLYAQLFRIGEGDLNNVFISDLSNAFGVYWRCDAKKSVSAKARDIKKQVFSAMQQFNSTDTGVIHIGMETFDGPEVERIRLEKINDTVSQIDFKGTNLKWIFCHYLQAYSPPNGIFDFDETVTAITPYSGESVPLENRFVIVSPEGDTTSNLFHWERPLP